MLEGEITGDVYSICWHFFSGDYKQANLELFQREQIFILTPIFESKHLIEGLSLMTSDNVQLPHECLRKHAENVIGKGGFLILFFSSHF